MGDKQRKLIENNIDLIEIEDWKALSKRIGPHDFCAILPIMREANIYFPFLPSGDDEDVNTLLYILSDVEENNIPLVFASLLSWGFWSPNNNPLSLDISTVAHIAHDLGFNVFKSKIKNPGGEWPQGYDTDEDYMVTELDLPDAMHEYRNIWAEGDKKLYPSPNDFEEVNW